MPEYLLPGTEAYKAGRLERGSFHISTYIPRFYLFIISLYISFAKVTHVRGIRSMEKEYLIISFLIIYGFLD